MKSLLLIILLMGLFYISGAQQVKVPVMTGNVTGQKELADKNVAFNVGSAIPYLYRGGSSTKLQVGFPYNALYIDRTFPGELFASKGYFPDQIQIRWEVINNKNGIAEFWIYRKKLNEKDSVWVDNVDKYARKWEDFYAEANEIYQYTVVAIGIPGEQSEGYTKITGIGFRTPLSTVTGRVSFSGGNGVKNVVITASTEDDVPSKSLSLTGSSYINIPQYVEHDFSAGFTFQAYLKFSSTANAGIFQKDSNFELTYTDKKFVFKVGSQSVELPFDVPTNEFMHVSAIYNGDSAKIMIPYKTANGADTLFLAKAVITNSISPNQNSFQLGKAGTLFFTGNMDEVRIWKRALEKEEIFTDFNRYLIGKENGFFAYLRMNEGFGKRVYDISKSGSNFNENHGDFVTAGVTWSSVVPKIEQLGNRGITDQEGNYIIAGIPFLTDGSAYKFTPMLAPHEFNPGYKILFISENSVVHNNIDFTDISAFNVNGSVVYRNTTKGVKGVQILIDGQPVYGPDTRPEETNEQGLFEIQVPIGYHFISLKKDGHVFDAGGRWPYDEAHPDSIIRHNFNQNLTFGKPFSDTTLITIVGRVIGGTSSNEIPFGFAQSVNNIGKATITLDHSSANPELTFDNINIANGAGKDTISYSVTGIDETGAQTVREIDYYQQRDAIETKIFTDPTTGEFVAKLIPEKFAIVDIDVDNDAENKVKNFFGNRVIDLSSNPQLKYEYLYDEDNIRIDSLAYHVKLNYIYQTRPEITVTNADDTELFYGEKEIPYTNPVNGVQSTIVVANHFRYPVFEMMKNYYPKISVFESYKNFDSEEITSQAVKEAQIQIINDLAIADNQKVYDLKPEMDGVVVDNFKVGVPNITKSEFDKTSFTKTMQINVTVDGTTFPWKPGPEGEFYRAYIIGQRPKGNNFYTEGLDVPEIILRDPPGSQSSAYIEKGSSYSVSSKYSTDLDMGSGFGLEILLGVKAAAGGGLAGPVIESESKNSGTVGLAFSTVVSESGEYVQTYEFTERVETSSDPGVVGSMGDIYIGKSYNYFYGETDHLKIVPYNLATTNGIIALGNDELKKTDFTIGIVDGFIMSPDNSETYFKYTQAHILNKLLPEIESRRNSLFLSSYRTDGILKYNSEIDASDMRYGIAHSYDVEIIGNDTIVNGYYKMTDTDSILTYSFRPEMKTIADLNNIKNDAIYEIDSIRYYNNQINIWIDAIRLNETEKATAIQANNLEQNISFDGAVGSISRKQLQTISYNKEETRTKNLNFSAQGSIGFLFNKVGVVATGELHVAHSLGVSIGENFSQTMEYGYTLADGNVGDYYSINVYRRINEGIFNADSLSETKMELPADFVYDGLTAVGGALAAGIGIAASGGSYNVTGGGVIVAGATVLATLASQSFKPYNSFIEVVKDTAENFDPGDHKVSSFDISSPIFSTLGGATMCPYQGLEHTFFYRKANGDTIPLHKATLQREKPEITAEPYEVFNVPSTEAALFNLKLTNNTESGDDQWYVLRVNERTNQKGALVLIDGEFSQKLILVPANTTVTKLVTIQPSNPSVMDFDSIGFILHSVCQFDPTDFMPEIADTVFISAHFQPSCTSVEILEPLDNWVVNVRDEDKMTVRIGNYNLAHDSFESFRFEYKSASGNIWVPVKYFVNDPLLANKDDIQDTVLINDQPFINFDWNMTNLSDRSYDIRVVSSCNDYSENESTILTGILDGQRPQIFGTPQPADGILNVDENISIQFNEPIESGLLNQFNFDLKGTLNYYLLKHEAYLKFNGTNDYSVIPEGISLNDKSFTIEFWIRPEIYGDAIILSQGNNPATSIEIGLRNGHKTWFKIGNVEFEAAFQFTSTVPAEAWQHMAYVFDYETGDVFIYQNDKIILEVRGSTIAINNSGKIYIGKSSESGGGLFAGSMHELRIWSKFLSLGDVYANQYTALSGNEVGLYGYWPIDEAFGKLAIDKAANRHMQIYAQWEAYPGGLAWNFSGENCLEFSTGYFAIIPEMDYTVEFWFRDNNLTDTVSLFSNQKGNGKEGSNLLEKALNIYATPDGKIWVASKGSVFEAVTTNYFDNSWHHFALVVRRRGNVTAFIDGQPQNEKPNTIVGGIAGGKMALGARKWSNISGSGEDWFYPGKLDEFRLWNLAKSAAQIRLDMNSKLTGNEVGLMVYFPFEGYYEDNLGVIQQKETLENFDDDLNATNAAACVGNAFTTDAPNMKDVRPVQSIAYDYVASLDQIIINPKAYLFPQLEKNIMEITVEGVEDKYGNRMASPVTWTAYVSRNQVRWEDERRTFAKEIYQSLEFVSTIKNTGGQQIGFTITNLPPWLTATPSSGVINPESTREITFTINPALNIGEYNQDIILRTENGFDEKLPLTVRVYKKPPNWTVDPSKFEATMNIVGVVKIEGILSTDIFDLVAVFKKGTDSIRGVNNVRYISDFDAYLVFLNVYGNGIGEELEFRLWDASAGHIIDDITPYNEVFRPNAVMGTTLDPVVFEAMNKFRQYIPLAKGWNWVSFNKLASNQNNLDSFFGALKPQQNDQIKSHGVGFNNFDMINGWNIGGIDSIDNRRMYQIKISNVDTIVYSGEKLVPENNPVILTAGWNHIGYLPDLSMDINDALRLYVAGNSEIIKSQFAFSMFDERVGWVGTLEMMQPGLGYMLKVNKGAPLTYPNNTVFKGAKVPHYTSPPLGWNSNFSDFEGNISVVARLDLSGFPELTVNSEMVLGSFINKECHGFISPLSSSSIGYEPFFLTVGNSENGQQVSFRLYDGATGNTYTIAETVPFVADAVYGNIPEPTVLTLKSVTTGAGDFGNSTLLRCYPNPFNEQVNVEFTGTNGSVKIDVVNATGAVIKSIYNGYAVNGLNTAVWDGNNQMGKNVSAGIYYIRFVSGDTVETVKISKTK
jgi:hypothetical protein